MQKKYFFLVWVIDETSRVVYETSQVPKKTGSAYGYAHTAVGWRIYAVPSLAPIEVEPGWTTWGLEVNFTVILRLS